MLASDIIYTQKAIHWLPHQRGIYIYIYLFLSFAIRLICHDHYLNKLSLVYTVPKRKQRYNKCTAL